MAAQVVANTTGATMLQSAVQTRLVELGWSTDGADDNSLAEYVVLMLQNGKTPQQVGAEMSSDMGMDEAAASDFGHWLSEQIQLIGGQPAEDPQSAGTIQHRTGTPQEDAHSSGMVDADMNDAADSVDQADTSMCVSPYSQEILTDMNSPTGPRSMRDQRSNTPRGRDRRMLGHVNKALDRSGDGSLHRIKGAAGGAGRINTHAHPPRGPRNQMNTRGGHAQRMTNVAAQAMQNGLPGTITPQQQMQLLAMYEQQAQMMASIFNGQSPPNFPGQMQTGGKSLFDRVGKNGRHGSHNQTGQQDGEDMLDAPTDGSMDVDGVRPDSSTTMCRFNLSCTNPNCFYVHQSPAATPGTTVDMADTCSFGVACKNRKCVGKHPSPAKLGPMRSEQECKFYPNCTNPSCPFKHPTMPPCRNGADCSVSGCKFSHTKTECKFNPCLNPVCPFKHKEGQRRGTFQDKVWTSGVEGDGDAHVSERNFVTEEGEEDLVIPGKSDQDGTPAPEGLVT